jgi:hypothetical protein
MTHAFTIKRTSGSAESVDLKLTARPLRGHVEITCEGGAGYALFDPSESAPDDRWIESPPWLAHVDCAALEAEIRQWLEGRTSSAPAGA